MYRIIKETNRLSGVTRYIIERKKQFLWDVSWTQDLSLRDIQQIGPVGAPTYDGALVKMQEIIAYDGVMLKQEVVQ